MQIKSCCVLKENAFFITNLVLEQTLEKTYHFGVCTYRYVPSPAVALVWADVHGYCWSVTRTGLLKAEYLLEGRYSAEP